MNEIQEKKQLTDRHKKAIAIIAFVIFLVFCGAVTWFIGRPMIKLIKQPEQFRSWVDSHGFFGNLIFLGMMILQVIIALIPGEPLEIGAGYAFGAVEGSILVLIGTMLGSLLVFLLVRKFGVKLVEVFFSLDKIKNLKMLRDKKRLNFIVFFVFFLPGTPKDLLTYAVGLTDIPIRNFLILTSVARLPSIITSTVAGGALGEENYLFAVIVFGVTLIISLIGLVLYNRFYLTPGQQSEPGRKEEHDEESDKICG